MARYFQPVLVTPENVIHRGDRIQDGEKLLECLGGNDLHIPYYRQISAANGGMIGPVVAISGDKRACNKENEPCE